MSSRFGFTVLFGLLIILMCEKVAHGADGDLDGACLPGPPESCTDTAKHVCDTNQQPHICKIKSGSDCSAGDKCVDGATCDTSQPPLCACNSQRNATSSGLCAVLLGGSCAGGKICDTGLTCSSTAACNKVGVGDDCSGGKLCDTNLICQNATCKYKNGTDCSARDMCVAGAVCTGTPKVCVCGTSAAADGTCTASSTQVITIVGVGEACTATKTCDTAAGLVCESSNCKYKNGTECSSNDQKCVDGATCTGTPKVCVCGTGRTPATEEGKCAAGSDSVAVKASILLMLLACLVPRVF